MATYKSVETKHRTQRRQFFDGLRNLDRRSFLKVSAAALGATAGLVAPQSFTPVSVVQGAESPDPDSTPDFKFAYISDSHLYTTEVNDRFVRGLLRAVDDVNHLDPQPDFVFYGGDLAQLGEPKQLELGAQILKNLKAPLKIMVGEHDWYLDLGEKWQEMFGKPTYSFDHKGVHFAVLNSVVEDDFWTAHGMSPMERMTTVAGLDNAFQSRFQVGPEQRAWLKQDLAKLPDDARVIVFSHSPLYKLYKNWNFWTEDADEVQAILNRFEHVVVIHGHTHQLLTNRIGNIHFHGMLSTAWPWPYAPEGLPELTIQMSRADPFDPNDGCGDGEVRVHADGLIDKVYNLWNRDPITVSRAYMTSWGKQSAPPLPNQPAY